MIRFLRLVCLLMLAGLLTACSTRAKGPVTVTELRVVPQSVATGSLPSKFPSTLPRAPIDPDGAAPLRGMIGAAINAAKQYQLCAVNYNALSSLIDAHNSAAAQIAAAGDGDDILE
jgi:hypothetical protein